MTVEPTSLPLGSGGLSVEAFVRPQPTAAEIGDVFVPVEPEGIDGIDIPVGEIEALILKLLLQQGARTGREIATQLQLPGRLVFDLLQGLKQQLYVAYKQSVGPHDYLYEIREAGATRAHMALQASTYCGSVPVGLQEYRSAMMRQAMRNVVPSLDDVRRAFADLTLSPTIVGQLGQAIASGRSLFLYGPPGNGKTSVAERMMKTLAGTSHAIWIPRALSVNGEVIRLFDPQVHQPLPIPETLRDGAIRVDRRWVRIARPVVVVGGELDFRHLELTRNAASGICEAPLQLKSNGGCLVVDDFGRQRIDPLELLNRWIVPLERGHDYLTLPNGRSICVPFEQLLVFSTNLRPESICDEAFLRRLKYKVEFPGPDAVQFRELFLQTADRLGLKASSEQVDYVLGRLASIGQPLRFSHVNDLLDQVRDFCRFMRLPAEVTSRTLDIALHNHFATIGRPQA